MAARADEAGGRALAGAAGGPEGAATGSRTVARGMLSERPDAPETSTTMSLDLSPFLRDWPYEPGKLNVRLINGDDGEPQIQVRLDLGLLQMRVDGRPDGHRPEGFPSYLDLFEHALDAPEEDPHAKESLTEEDCRLLREEATQYYHRYIALLALEDYTRVVRDTTRNLRVLDLCAEHAEAESDRQTLEPLRPYITMMRARAMAGQSLKDNEPKAAIHAIDEGIEALRRYYAEHAEADGPDAFEQSAEVQMLRSLRETLVPKLPVSQTAELRQRLEHALQRENYELAAILRDELRMLKDQGGGPSPPARA